MWTPTGLRPIEEVRVGDRVISGDGTPCLVLAAIRDVQQHTLRFSFDRGEQIDCAENHPWHVLHPAARYDTRHSRGKVERNPRFGKWEVVTGAAILAASGPAPTPRRRFLMPTTAIIHMDRQTIPIDPYLLGLLLGDGCVRNGVRISSADAEIIDAVAEILPEGVGIRQERGYDYVLVLSGGKGHGQGGGFKDRGNPLTKSLRDLGVHGLLSGDKFVPSTYLNNAPDIRLAVLQGLMDTDGCISATHGAIEFSTTSPWLAGAVDYLACSFGGKVKITQRVTRFTDKNGERQDGARSFRVRLRLPQVAPFRLTRKLVRLVRPVSTCDDRVLWALESLGPTTCAGIVVDSLDQSFTLQHGIVAHGMIAFSDTASRFG